MAYACGTYHALHYVSSYPVTRNCRLMIMYSPAEQEEIYRMYIDAFSVTGLAVFAFNLVLFIFLCIKKGGCHRRGSR